MSSKIRLFFEVGACVFQGRHYGRCGLEVGGEGRESYLESNELRNWVGNDREVNKKTVHKMEEKLCSKKTR